MKSILDFFNNVKNTNGGNLSEHNNPNNTELPKEIYERFMGKEKEISLKDLKKLVKNKVQLDIKDDDSSTFASITVIDHINGRAEEYFFNFNKTIKNSNDLLDVINGKPANQSTFRTLF